MTKLTTAEALKLVERIEALQQQIDAVYREARDRDGKNNDSVIRDVIKERAAQRESAWNAEALLAGFDATDE